eukprot:TRINITY_DN285_c0_g1_i1.p1 TRINITY_DN285_c0_g1~~TRINITY_DN285_c0_g1_i1.p1  ORF type:complete len:539 (+),score=94.94 TRINITY_DN285_c0_g1_i1:160-1776(+)
MYGFFNDAAMGFPASKLEGTYRNKLSDVARMLHQRHHGSFMVWNLSERPYNYSKFDNQVLDCGFPDHTAPPLELLFKICNSIDSWLKADDRNVAVVHCMAGLGRTGTIICAYMLYARTFPDADSALKHFGKKRCKDGRGVRIPSQLRYVHYYDKVMKGHKPEPVPMLLKKVVVQPVPQFDRSGFTPILQLWDTAKEELLFSSVDTGDLETYSAEDDVVAFDVNMILTGDISVRCFHLTQGVINIVQEQAFRIMFHTAFVGSLLRCNKADMDWAFVDKRVSERITVDLIFSPEMQAEDIQRSRSKSTVWSSLTKKLVEAAPADKEEFDGEYVAVEAVEPLSLEPATAAKLHGVAPVNVPEGIQPRTRTPTVSASPVQFSSPPASSPVLTTGQLPKAAVVSAPASPSSSTRLLTCVVLHTVPRFNQDNGCLPCLQIWQGPEMVASVKADQSFVPDDCAIRLIVQQPLHGFVQFKFFDHSTARRVGAVGVWNLMFTASLDISTLTDDCVRLTRSHIKCAPSDLEKFDADFHCDLIFSSPDM